VIDYAARLLTPGQLCEDGAHVWYITHPLGKPAGDTYTAVVFAADVADAFVPAVLHATAHAVAFDLYGTAWAFIYPPNEYESAVGRFPMRCRERVLVTALDYYPEETTP